MDFDWLFPDRLRPDNPRTRRTEKSPSGGFEFGGVASGAPKRTRRSGVGDLLLPVSKFGNYQQFGGEAPHHELLTVRHWYTRSVDSVIVGKPMTLMMSLYCHW